MVFGAELPPRRDVAARRLARELGRSPRCTCRRSPPPARASWRSGSRGCSRACRSRGRRRRPPSSASGKVSIEWPGMNQVVLMPHLLEQPQQARRADLAGEHAARDVAGQVLAAVGPEPARHRVDVDAVAQQRFPSPSPYLPLPVPEPPHRRPRVAERRSAARPFRAAASAVPWRVAGLGADSSPAPETP